MQLVKQNMNNFFLFCLNLFKIVDKFSFFNLTFIKYENKKSSVFHAVKEKKTKKTKVG